MSPEAQRIAIAEARGYVLEPCYGRGDSKWWDIEGNQLHQGPPNYPSDLNAMHEAENTMTEEQSQEYFRTLIGIAGPFSAIRATAAQRAEAFLRTIGKWEDAP